MSYPTVLAFEDMQWADASLLDFVEYLLDWSRNSPALRDHAGPAGAARAAADLGRRAAQLHLALPGAARRRRRWRSSWPASCRGFPRRSATRSSRAPRASRSTRSRRCGCCSTAACSSRRAPSTGLTGPIEALEVPETLHALIAARLDGLSAEERRLLQDAAVLGKTFTRDALAALAGAEAELEPLLTALVRKEVLGVQADPRSPEHGQYGFLQDLVRHVAYETLSKRERRARHLAAAAHLSAAFAADEDEVVEVIASHYLAAHEAAPDADDAAEIRGKAQAMLARAGERAASLAAAAEARRYFEQAAELAEDPSERAALLDRAGEMASEAGDPDSARPLFEESIALHEAAGRHACRRPRSREAREARRLHGASRRGNGTDGARLRRHLGRRARRGSRAPRGASFVRVLVQRRSRACGRAGRAGAGHRRSACVPGAARARAAREGGHRPQSGTHGGGFGAPEARSGDCARPRPHGRSGHLLLHPLRPLLPTRRVRRCTRLPRRVPRPRTEARETVRTSGLRWPSGPTLCPCSVAGTRRRRRARSSRRSRSTPAESC